MKCCDATSDEPILRIGRTRLCMPYPGSHGSG
jgi:hypothetical protein